MQYKGFAMRWKTHVFFLWSLVYSTERISAYLHCQQTTNHTTPLRELKHCNLSLENSHLRAHCHILVKFPHRNPFIRFKKQIMTMKQLLVSEDTVRTISQGCAPVCLSLRRVELKIWDDFPDNLNSSYDHFEMAQRNDVSSLFYSTARMCSRQMTYDQTFDKHQLLAVAMCDSLRVNRSGMFNIYGFADRYPHAFQASLDAIDYIDFVIPSNISLNPADEDKLIITLLGKQPVMPELPTITHVTFYRCKFYHIWIRTDHGLESVQHLEFSQCPIEHVYPHAFEHIPSVKYISLTSTKLDRIPDAIFYLKTLILLNMSDTNVPPGQEFDFWPVSSNTKSSAEQLITSGTNLTLLHDRDLCGFPNLRELHMDRCNLEILEGRPFKCLNKLQVLSLQANKISALNQAMLEGLTGLSLLNLNYNRLTVFDGTDILIPLMSLRVLHISFNSIQQFHVDKPLNSSPEVLFAQHNRITSWTPPIFSRMTELKILDLSHNELAVLDNEMFLDLNGIQNVSLNFNPWDCNSCYLNNLHNFLNNHPVQCVKCVACMVPKEQQGYHVRSVAWREECLPLDYNSLYAAVGIFCIMFVAMLVYGAYKFRWYSMYVYLHVKIGMKGRRRQSNVGNYAWDAFVSYHNSDSDWVHNVLLQELESPPLNFRLCVAARDFIPGILITDNICRAITQSHVCLFVLSPAFCRSRWCMFELSFAQHHLSESERSDGLVFVKKEQVQECEMSNMLRLLTRSKTYIEVPPSNATERRNNIFWLRLQAALE